jgi:2-hydroxy-4-carboxymuconate semialdehyde hemiacetal dehydrogenase
MRICLAGEGAMGENHMKVLSTLPDIEVVTLAGGIAEDATSLADKWRVPHVSTDLETCLRQPGVEAVLLATPSPLHVAHVEMALGLGRHVLVEIPMALSLADSERLARLEERTGLVCMVCHTRRFNPPHVELRKRIGAGEFHLHHLIAEHYFFRRTDLNMFGKPRTWRDNLLWHHACHSVDLLAWVLDDWDLEVWGQRGPDHPTLGIPMDMTIGLRSPRKGALATIALSFNRKGPVATHYRYIGEEETYEVFREGMKDSEGREVALSGSGFENQDREFFAAIRERRRPEASFCSCLRSMELLHRIERGFVG